MGCYRDTDPSGWHARLLWVPGCLLCIAPGVRMPLEFLPLRAMEPVLRRVRTGTYAHAGSITCPLPGQTAFADPRLQARIASVPLADQLPMSEGGLSPAPTRSPGILLVAEKVPENAIASIITGHPKAPCYDGDATFLWANF